MTGARTTDGSRYFGMIKMAQTAVLPESRRKFMMSRVNVPPGFDAHVAKAVAEMLAKTEKPAPEPATTPAPQAESAPEPQRVVVNVQHGRTPLADYKEDELAVEILRRMLAKSFKLDAVADQLHALASRVDALELKAAELSKYGELITDELGMLNQKIAELRPTPPAVKADASSPAPAAEKQGSGRQPRIAIVGLLKAQFEQIKSKVGKWPVQLEFVDQDKNPHRIGGADFIVYARWISHTWPNCNSHLTRSQWAFANGGHGQVVELVEKAARELCKASQP